MKNTINKYFEVKVKLQKTMEDLKEILSVFDALELDSRPMGKDAPAAVPGSPDTAELSTGNHIDPK